MAMHENTSNTINPTSQIDSLYTISLSYNQRLAPRSRRIEPSRRGFDIDQPWMNFWTVRPRTHHKSYITSPVRCWHRSQPDGTGLVMVQGSMLVL